MGTFMTMTVGDRAVRLYVAGNMEPGTPGVALFHAWWGLNDDVAAFADRLAAAGFAVAAPDMFDGKVATAIEGAEALAGSSDEAAIETIALAAVDELAQHLGADTPITALGFSFGAAWAVWLPSKSARISATAVYYGTWTGAILGQATVPVLGHFAEDDPYETAETVDSFEQGLKDAGRRAELYRYPGTGHWFAEPSRDAYRAEAANLAFERTVAFLKHLRRA